MSTEDPNKTVIYVDVEDDISTIIEKLQDAPKSVVALVLPKRSTVLQSTVNMRLLKQSGESANKKLALVTSEAALLPLAGAVGLAVSKDLQSLPEIPTAPEVSMPKEPSAISKQLYASSKPSKSDEPAKEPTPTASVGALSDAHDRKEPETVELEDEAPEDGQKPKTAKTTLAGMAAGAASKIPGVKVPNFDKFRKWFILGGVGFVALIVFLYLAIAVLPKAVISITTTATPVSLNTNLTSSGGAKSLDETNSIIPSSVQTYNQTAKKSVTATGQQNIGQKATGTLTIQNCDTSTPPTLPAGTVFTASTGQVFLSTAAFTPTPAAVSGGHIQCGSSSNVGAVAQAAGDSYNIAATTYTTDSLDSNYNINGSTMSGGSSQIVTVVSQQDASNAAAAVANDTTQPSQATVTKQFEAQLDSQGYYLIATSLKVGSPVTTSSPAVGQQATSATVTVTTTYSVLAVKKADLTKLVTDFANKQIDTTKQKIDDTDILSNVTIAIANQSSPTDASLTLSGSVNAVPILDATTIKQDAVGKKSGDVQATIASWPGIKSVTVKVSPFWVSSVPSKTSKVIVHIQAASGSN